MLVALGHSVSDHHQQLRVIDGSRQIPIRFNLVGRFVVVVVGVLVTLLFAVCRIFPFVVDTGIDYEGKDAAYSKQKRDEYTNNDYHKPSDQIKPDWDLTGAVDDAQLLMMIGYRVAQGDKHPEWKAGSEFKAKRDETMKGTTSSRPSTP